MRLPSLLTACAWMLSTAAVFADAKLTGNVNYQFGAQNATVTINCASVANASRENATGTLKLELWAVDAPYESGTINGRILAAQKLDGLNPGAAYNNLRENLKTTLPAARRSYYLCLTLLEYKRGAYVIVDHRNFASPVVLGPAALFTLTGPWRWQTSDEGGTLHIHVAKISHTRPGVTGTLKLVVWATKWPYHGGAIEGWKLGEVKKDALQPGYTYSDVHNTAKYFPPPRGTYYVTLVLEEFDGAEYRIESYLNSNGPSEF